MTLHDQIGRLAPGSADRAQAVLELKTVSAKLDTLRTNISAINASVNTNPGYIITSAVPPSSAASPQPLLYLPSGLLAGLLAGLVAAFAADRRDDRVHTVREAERLDGLPVLYSVDARRLSPPGAVAPARSAAGRGYAELAQAVAAGLGEKDRVLLVAAGSPGPAAGVVAANLAAALARVRADVILVCADPRDTMTPALLGVGAARGLAEVLGGTATVAEVTRQAADISRLEVITPGRDPAAAPGQVRHDVTERLVDGLRRDARYVIICGLASGDGADTFGLAEFADAALVVTRAGADPAPGAGGLPAPSGPGADPGPGCGAAARDHGGPRPAPGRCRRAVRRGVPAAVSASASTAPGSIAVTGPRRAPARHARTSGLLPARADPPADPWPGPSRPAPRRAAGSGRAPAGRRARATPRARPGRRAAAGAGPRARAGPRRAGRPRPCPAGPAAAPAVPLRPAAPLGARRARVGPAALGRGRLALGRGRAGPSGAALGRRGPVSKDLSWDALTGSPWGTDDPAGRESPHGPSGRSRPEPPWDSAAPAGAAPDRRPGRPPGPWRTAVGGKRARPPGASLGTGTSAATPR